MIKQEIIFSHDGIQLGGSLYKPEGQGPFPAVIVLHAAQGGSREFPSYQHLTTYLPAQGIAVLIYDRRGSGSSTGNFETADFHDLAGDALAAVDYLSTQKDIDARQIGAYGISQGGWIAPLVAAQRPDLAFLVIVSGSGVSPVEQMAYASRYALQKAGFSEEIIQKALSLEQKVNQYYRKKLPMEQVKTEIERVEAESWFPYTFIGDSTQLPKDVTQDKWYYELDYDPLPVWQQVTQPTLFIFADEDQWVPVAESMANFKFVTRHLRDVTLVEIAGTDHLMGDRNSEKPDQVSDHYLQILTAWLAKRIGSS